MDHAVGHSRVTDGRKHEPVHDHASKAARVLLNCLAGMVATTGQDVSEPRGRLGHLVHHIVVHPRACHLEAGRVTWIGGAASLHVDAI